jgi:hypothetical protein
VDEPLPIGPLHLDVEVAVRVRPVEDPVGDVVHAEVEPGVRASLAQVAARGLDRVVAHLPVDEHPIGVHGHGRDPVLAVAPGYVLERGPLRRLPQLELGTGRALPGVGLLFARRSQLPQRFLEAGGQLLEPEAADAAQPEEPG